VVVAGSANETDGPGATSAYYTAKYAATNGALLWEKFYDGPAGSYNYLMAAAVDSSGNVAVTGGSISEANGDYYTAKYAAANGALLWEKRYDGPGNSDDQANALAVDASGNVVVTGYSVNTNGNTDYYTAKYAAADGALLWEKRYGGVVDGYDQANAMVLDASGNVVVTGASQNDSDNSDYYTAKYAAANGALLWEHRYNGPAEAYDFADAIAVDASGNVVVTGQSGNGTDTDFYTAKYAAANGALLWEKRYDGPGNGDDNATAVAVDGSGNVVVTGYSVGSGGTNDYYTAKYAAANGALLWEKRYHGPANGDDYASSLALGPNGIVAITGSSVGDSGTSDDFATVVYWENLPPVSLAQVPTGIRLRFVGAPSQSYHIERANTVTGLWSTLATPTAPLGGLIEYVDTNAPAGAAFYRTRTP
jgi:outer membrane protein assembly factor BamB